MAQLGEPFDEEETKQKLYELGLTAVDSFTAPALINYFQKKYDRPVRFNDYGFDSPEDLVRSIPLIIEVAPLPGIRFKCIQRSKPPIAPMGAPPLQPMAESPPLEEDPVEALAVATAVGEDKEEEVADTIETEDAGAVEVEEREQSSSDKKTDDSEEDTDDEEGETEEMKRDEEETKLGEERERLPQINESGQEGAQKTELKTEVDLLFEMHMANLKAREEQEAPLKPKKSVSYDEITTVFQYSTNDSDDDDFAEFMTNATKGIKLSSRPKGIIKKTSGGGLLNQRTTVFVDELSSDDDEDLEEEDEDLEEEEEDEHESEEEDSDEDSDVHQWAELVDKQKQVQEAIDEAKKRIRLLPWSASTSTQRDIQMARLTNLIKKGRAIASEILRLQEKESDDDEEKSAVAEEKEAEKVDARVQEVAVKPTKSVFYDEISTVCHFQHFSRDSAEDDDDDVAEVVANPTNRMERCRSELKNPLTQRIPIVVDELSADESDHKEKSVKPDLADEDEPDKVDSGEKDEESHADRASGEECSHPSFFVEEKGVEKMDVGKEGSMTRECPVEIASPEDVAEPAVAREKEVEKVDSGEKPLENQKEGVDEYASDDSREPSIVEEKNAEEVASGAEVPPTQKDRAVQDSSAEELNQSASSVEQDSQKAEEGATDKGEDGSSMEKEPAAAESSFGDESSQPVVVEEHDAEKTNSSRQDDLPRDTVEEVRRETSAQPKENEAIKVSTIAEAVPVAVGKGGKEGSQQAEKTSGGGLLNQRTTVFVDELSSDDDEDLEEEDEDEHESEEENSDEDSDVEEEAELVAKQKKVQEAIDEVKKRIRLLPWSASTERDIEMARLANLIKKGRAIASEILRLQEKESDDDEEESDQSDVVVDDEPKKVDSGDKEEKSASDRSSGKEYSQPAVAEEKETEKVNSGLKMLMNEMEGVVETTSFEDSTQPAAADEKDANKEVSMSKERSVKEEILSPKQKSLKRRHDSDGDHNADKAYGSDVTSHLQMAEKSGTDLDPVAKKIVKVAREGLPRD